MTFPCGVCHNSPIEACHNLYTAFLFVLDTLGIIGSADQRPRLNSSLHCSLDILHNILLFFPYGSTQKEQLYGLLTE